MKSLHSVRVAAWVISLAILADRASGQGTAFTYQGRLYDGGTIANGTYDLTFALFYTNISGSAVAGPLTNRSVVVSNGLLTVTVDFGPGVFTGPDAWLELAARTNGAGQFTILAPRQPITPAPYSIMAGKVAAGGLPAGLYGNAVSFTNAANGFAGAFAGDGSRLANVSGTLPWQGVTVTSVQAAPNAGYVVTNSSQDATITLPVSPNLGDRLGISCPGHGWRLSQNAGQIILGQNILGPGALWSQSLAPSSASQLLRCLVSSPDGTHLAASGPLTALVWVSHDAGASWSSTGVGGGYVCLSADGRHLIYAAPGAGILASSNSGTNFDFQYANAASWRAVACSADGSHATAVVAGGGIFVSTDFGTNWTPSGAASNVWEGVAMSADGSHQVAPVFNGQIYTSADFGSNWTVSASSPSGTWSAIASSADGTHLLGSMSSGQIYLSADSGATWTPSSAPVEIWLSVASSADGTRLVAAAVNTLAVSISTDSGATWSFATMPVVPGAQWQAVASSAAGTLIASDVANGGIYLRPLTTTSGATGYLTGGQFTAVQLQYVGNGQFLPLSHEGTLLAH